MEDTIIAMWVCSAGFVEPELSEQGTGNSPYTANYYAVQYNIWICS